MKKRLLILMICLASVLSSMSVGATKLVVTSESETTVEPETHEEIEVVETPVVEDLGFAVIINGQRMDNTTAVFEDVHYVPLRTVFEKAGARVYFRSRDRQILVLTRDGDMVCHIVGTNTISVNGQAKTLAHPSVSKDHVTYLPVDMLAAALRADAVTVENQQITVHTPIPNTDYGKAVNDTLYAGMYGTFNPEKFQRYINYHIKNPGHTMNGVIFTVNIGLDLPFYENVSVIANPYDPLVLVNKYNRLPSNFRPQNLVQMNRNYTSGGKEYLMEKTAYDSFVRMVDAARKEGVSMRAVSTYRTEDYQKRLYDKKVRTTGQRNADNYSARPGFSEHQTGLAVDINSTSASFENSKAFRWLQQHAHEYGFILRYPKGKTWITGYAYEPWHYRYVGVQVATSMKREGLNYEQYCALYRTQSEFQ